MPERERPKVGVGVFIIKGNEVLLGKRKASHGIGEYGGSGGHQEHGESFEETALREIEEEMGSELRIKNLGFLCVTNMRKYFPKHYVDIGMYAEYESGEPKTMEPHKLESWDWHPLDTLPAPLFGCFENYVQAYKTGQVYFED
jgi:8-oxo-dGTP diphosphatase